ncbi:MAG: asparagine synthetase B family protein, partial [Anaerolineales bacterium]
MSGVFGVLDSKRGTPIKPLLTKMGTRMSHREWYVVETYTDEGAGVGLGRIGIGIFNKTSQPVWNSTHTVALVMAGELYNRDALGRNGDIESDEQVALALYEKLGDDFVSQLNGAFIIALWDTTRHRLLIANDRFGLYPTFIAQVGNRFLFAPEIKGVLVDPDVDRSLCDESIAEYMRFQRLLGFKTFFTGVTMLPPASISTYDYDAPTYRLRRYWDMSSVPLLPESITFEEAVEEGSRLFRAAVRKMTKGPERIGVFLSGGLDGRSILGMLSPDGRTIHTFTFGQPGCRDEYYARQIAKDAGAQHHYYPYENGHWIREFADLHLKLTEGFHPWIHMHGISMLSDVRQHVDVNLSGLGDLLWTQSNFTPLHLVKAPDDLAFNSLLFEFYSQKYSWPGITYAEERFLYHESFYPRARGLAFDSFIKELEPFAGLPYPQRVAAFNLINHFSRHLLYAAIFGRSHIEFRFPYCDLELMSFCYGLPFELGYDRRLQKAIIAREMPGLARVPYDTDELPITSRNHRRTIAYIKKKLKNSFHQYVAPIFPPRLTLYADYEEWLRTDLRSWAESILFDERTLGRGIFRPEALHSLMDRHLSGQEKWTIGKIAPIITFEMMLREFYDTSQV